MSNKIPKVLWVEDEARGALSPLGERLRRSGIELDIATSFDAAERRLSSATYSAVLLDILIPHSGKETFLPPDLGVQLARLIRNGQYQKVGGLEGTPANIPIVALTVVRRDEIEDDIESLDIKHFDKTMLLEKDYISQLINALHSS